jgi:ABC-type multidrug transport system fused ATPase/permease subunit
MPSTADTRRRIQRLMDDLLGNDDRYGGSAAQDLRRLWRDYLPAYRLQLVTASIAAIAIGAVQMLIPLTARFLADDVLCVQTGFDATELARQDRLLMLYVAMVFGIWAVYVGGYWFQSRQVLGVSRDFALQLRRQLFEQLQVLHVGYYSKTPSGKIVARVMDDVNVIRQTIASHLVTLVTSLARLATGMVVVIWLNPRLSLLLLLALPFYWWVFMRLRPQIRRSSIALRRLNSQLYARAGERIGAIQVITAFAQEKRELRETARVVFDYVRLGNLLVFMNHLLTFSAATITAVCTAGALWLCALEVRAGTMTIGDMIAFYGATALVFAPVANLTSLAAQFQAVMVVLRRVLAVIDEPVDVVSGSAHLSGTDGRIRFEDVTFTYPDQDTPTLREFELAIDPGERVAIMGPSGGGKSTLFQLLLRFYDPDTGHVKVGDLDLVDADIGSVRRHVCMVQQEPVIFAGTIAENVIYGRPDATPAMVMQACQRAELHDFIMSMPVKYETVVGESGVTLSGGQRQRLALATALLTDPEVLLLDDTTSALDAGTESRIRTTLNHVLHGRTSLIITQRVATARDCERIVVLQDGKVSQTGTHDELAAQPGFYRDICEQQNMVT